MGRKFKEVRVTWIPIDKDVSIECVKIVLGKGWEYKGDKLKNEYNKN